MSIQQTNIQSQNRILRQNLSNRFVHWLTALAIFLLTLTGFGQMPLYGRYNITKLPGAAWLGNYFITLKVHYFAASLLLFIAIYHVVYHLILKNFDILPRRGDFKESLQIIKAMLTKGEEPPSHKYLAEQRLAYFFIALNILLLIITGIIKVLKNTPGLSFSTQFVYMVTLLHNIGTVLLLMGVVGHLVAFVFKENRKLLPGMFHGYVDYEYAAKRHCLWCKENLVEAKDSKETT